MCTKAILQRDRSNESTQPALWTTAQRNQGESTPKAGSIKTTIISMCSLTHTEHTSSTLRCLFQIPTKLQSRQSITSQYRPQHQVPNLARGKLSSKHQRVHEASLSQVTLAGNQHAASPLLANRPHRLQPQVTTHTPQRSEFMNRINKYEQSLLFDEAAPQI